MNDLIAATTAYVKEYMSSYDSSHDYAHIRRVLRNAELIYTAPTSISSSTSTSSEDKNETKQLNHDVLILACLLHDINDHKYRPASNSHSEGAAPETPARDFLLSQSAPADVADAVQVIVDNVSYSHEARAPAVVAAALAAHPELGVVQDADRLDALGAVGVGRCFTYSASRAAKLKSSSATGESQGGEVESSMDDSVAHFEEKLVKLEGMMKTAKGRELARERTRRIREFQRWWAEEEA